MHPALLNCLSAFLLLEREQNVDKVQGVMRDALTDFKSAIDAWIKPMFRRCREIRRAGTLKCSTVNSSLKKLRLLKLTWKKTRF